MTEEPLVWAAAIAQVLTAAGIAVFWLTWFREAHAEPWLPAGYVDHERVFVYPDTILAGLLVGSATLSVLGEDLGRTLSLVTAGMLLFLGIIDLAYFAQHRMFLRARGGVVNAGVVSAVLALSVFLVVVHH